MKQIVSGNRFQNQKAPILICIKCENKINKFPYGKSNKTEREKGGRRKESASIFFSITICDYVHLFILHGVLICFGGSAPATL